MGDATRDVPVQASTAAPTPGTSLQYARSPRVRRIQLAYDFQPGGLRTGSPPSPPPHSIRPTVRRLLWSPRLLGPGPRGQRAVRIRRPSPAIP